MGVSANGNPQFKKAPEQQLLELVVGSLYGKDSYYESGNDKVARMIKVLDKVVELHGVRGARYAMNVARLAREEMSIRTMPIVMTVELAKILRDRNLQLDQFKEAIAYIIQRADELTDMYAYALSVFGDKSKIPMVIKKGVAVAFNKFDAYQFGKYNRDNEVSFRDLLRMVHPKPANETMAEIFVKIISETLESPHTWETVLSKNGQLGDQQKSKAELWTELVTREGSGSMGYMALLRNLRNMKDAAIADETWQVVADRIKNPVAVAGSKQLPFGFINAYDVAKDNNVPSIVQQALQEATEQSLRNIPKLGDRVWVILDASGSMNMGLHDMLWNTKTTGNPPIKIGAIFGAALVKAAQDSFQVRFTMFDDDAQHVDLNPKDSIFTLYQKIMNRNAGGGTNLQAALNAKKTLGFEPDTVIVLSDMEVNRLDSRSIDRMFTDDCVKVAVNLAGGTTTPLAEQNGWIQLMGWSERIFQFVDFTRKSDGIVAKLMTD